MSAARALVPGEARHEESPLLVRPAAEGDVDQIVAIERDSFADPWTGDAFATLVKQGQAWLRVAVDLTSGRVAGYVVAWFVVDQAEIANIAVARGYRGRGVGARLLDEALDAAARRGATSVFLEVRESNAVARGLYAGRGFTEVGRRRQYYQHPVEDALVLRRQLAGREPPPEA
jgi:ribosomal-protein-alanine N-acetyltransferase